MQTECVRKTGERIRTKDFWDKNPCGTSSTWNLSRELRFSTTDPYLVPVFRSPLLKDRRVLEVGCGQGFDAAEIVKHCRSYVGIDLSTESVTIARQQVCNSSSNGNGTTSQAPATFLAGDAGRLPFPDASFDAAYSVGVLHHTPYFDAAIDEIHRVLKPGGSLILMLYHSFTPLWAVLRTVRGALRTPLVGPYVKRRMLNRMRARDESPEGTALMELVGCPIIDTYTLRGLRRRFGDRFRLLESQTHRVGFDQVVRVLPSGVRRIWPQRTVEGIDRSASKWFGFYLLTMAEKQ